MTRSHTLFLLLGAGLKLWLWLTARHFSGWNYEVETSGGIHTFYMSSRKVGTNFLVI